MKEIIFRVRKNSKGKLYYQTWALDDNGKTIAKTGRHFRFFVFALRFLKQLIKAMRE